MSDTPADGTNRNGFGGCRIGTHKLGERMIREAVRHTFTDKE